MYNSSPLTLAWCIYIVTVWSTINDSSRVGASLMAPSLQQAVSLWGAKWQCYYFQVGWDIRSALCTEAELRMKIQLCSCMISNFTGNLVSFSENNWRKTSIGSKILQEMSFNTLIYRYTTQPNHCTYIKTVSQLMYVSYQVPLYRYRRITHPP